MMNRIRTWHEWLALGLGYFFIFSILVGLAISFATVLFGTY